MPVESDASESYLASAEAWSCEAVVRNYRLLSDASPVTSWTAGPAGQINFIGEGALRSAPADPANPTLTSIRWEDLLHPDDVEITAATWRRSAISGQNYCARHRMKIGDSYRWVLSQAKAVIAPDASIHGWLGSTVNLDDIIAEEGGQLQAESRYRALVAAASAVVYECSADGQFASPQSSWQRFTGQPWEEHQGFGWSRMIHPDDRAKAEAALLQSVRTDAPYRVDVRLWCAAADAYHRCRISAAGTRDDGGNIFEWVGMIADVEDNLQQAERLREDQGRLALSIEAAEIGTFHCPMPLNKIIWNARCRQHFWLAPDEEVDFDRFYSIVHPDDRQTVREAVTRAVSNTEPYDIEYRTVSPQGAIRWIRAKGSSYVDASGQPVRFDGITIDISDQKALQAQRDALLERERIEKAAAQNASRLKDSFLATVSHELRTPLNAMQTWIYLLRQNHRDFDIVFRALDSIERNVRVQSKLVDDLLDISRITSGKLFLEIETVSLKNIVNAAISDVKAAALIKDVQITVVTEHDASVGADVLRLRQVFINVLDNAVKHSKLGGSVKVSLDIRAKHVKVLFADNGDGIAPDFMQRLFEPFTQADDAIGRHHEGLGIGLAIAANIVDLHGGSITARSEGIGRGSEFIVTLPRVESADVLETDFIGTSSPRAIEAPRFDGVRVLIVEDNLDALEALAAVFNMEGAQVSTAESASAARHLLSSRTYDAITSDIGMPGEDGYSLMRWIREQNISTPAVALTAFTRPEDEARAYHAGFDRFHPKPVHPPQLLDLVSDLLSKGVGTERRDKGETQTK